MPKNIDFVKGKPKIIVIVGPTASGKSALAIKIARRLNGEIVSADSRQIYGGMDIGTAKPKLTLGEKREILSEGIPHYLLDIKNPDENYTVAEYKRDAIMAIRKILRKGKLPILVGGTGLYIKAVVENLDIPKVTANLRLREKLEKELASEGLAHLFQKLVDLDPETRYIVDPKNPRRVIRALEIAIVTGKPLSAQRKTGKRLFDALQIGVSVPKMTLNKKIDSRVDKMFKKGLMKEVRNLTRKYGPGQRVFDAIGYREIIDYLDKKISLAETTELIKKNTRAYAKRQMTWFRKDKNVNWIHNKREALLLAKEFLKQE